MFMSLNVNYPLFLSCFNSLVKFFKNPQISNFMKICPVGAELFHPEGQTNKQADRNNEANSRFS